MMDGEKRQFIELAKNLPSIHKLPKTNAIHWRILICIVWRICETNSKSLSGFDIDDVSLSGDVQMIFDWERQFSGRLLEKGIELEDNVSCIDRCFDGLRGFVEDDDGYWVSIELDGSFDFERIIRQTEYSLIEARKEEHEFEVRSIIFKIQNEKLSNG